MDQIISRNPARPSDVVCRTDPLGSAELGQRLRDGAAASAVWARDAGYRAHALERWAHRTGESAERLARLISREVGKPISEARAEVARAEAILRYYAQAAYGPIGEVLPGASRSVEVHVRREPLGMVVAITPWNFPLAIPAWKVAPALAFGNTVILKAASAALGSASAFLELGRPEIPEAVLTLATIPAAQVGPVLQDRRVHGVTFTGSTAAGSTVLRIGVERGIAVQAEMGGFNSAIVLDDADLDDSVPLLLSGAMGYAGQKCTATRRVLAGRAIVDELTDRLASAVESIAIGDPREDDIVVGPLIDEASVRAFNDNLYEAERAGARVVARREPPASDGWFAAPTILAVEADNPFLRHETFGPALAIQVVASAGEAVDAANATSYGLCAAVHGGDVAQALAVADQLDVGMVRVNGPTTGVDFWAPFGGTKDSSYGPREQGSEARQFFTKTKTVTVPRVTR